MSLGCSPRGSAGIWAFPLDSTMQHLPGNLSRGIEDCVAGIFFPPNQLPNLLLIAVDVLLFLPKKQPNKDLLVCTCACGFKKVHTFYKVKTEPRVGKVA